jgi:hypothetical protein
MDYNEFTNKLNEMGYTKLKQIDNLSKSINKSEKQLKALNSINIDSIRSVHPSVADTLLENQNKLADSISSLRNRVIEMNEK